MIARIRPFISRNTFGPGPADITLTVGRANADWIPLAGDWDGDGIDTVGLYKPALAKFALKNGHVPGQADFAFHYGIPNWKPVTGDWNQDGIDTIGIYVPDQALFLLRNTNTTGTHEIGFVYGMPHWAPLVGDWSSELAGHGFSPAAMANRVDFAFSNSDGTIAGEILSNAWFEHEPFSTILEQPVESWEKTGYKKYDSSASISSPSVGEKGLQIGLSPVPERRISADHQSLNYLDLMYAREEPPFLS